jgi:exopolysaccharide biosynthesis protein
VASLLAVVLAVLAPRASEPQRLRLAGPEFVADGIELYRSTDNSMLDEAAPGPISLVLARLDPRKVTLATALANDCAPSRETVQAIAERERAIVAINAGFFAMRGAGAPAGLLKHRGRWISGTSRARGAVAFLAHGQQEPARLVFGRVTVAASIAVSALWRSFSIPLAHLSPEPATGGLSFYAAPCGDVASHFSESAAGTELAGPTTPGATRTWSLEPIGPRWKVRSMAALPAGAPGAAWLVYRGPAVPPALERIRVGTTLTVAPRVGAPDSRVWRDAPDAVGGAGLLVAGGSAVTDWAPEKTVDTFRTDRHPRTVIGVDGDGSIWLIAVDGRNPTVSVGMSFAELQRACLALGLRDALNLDGGGSTTLVVNGQVVNQPSDVTGPRPVSDAIVVRLRRAGS